MGVVGVVERRIRSIKSSREGRGRLGGGGVKRKTNIVKRVGMYSNDEINL